MLNSLILKISYIRNVFILGKHVEILYRSMVSVVYFQMISKKKQSSGVKCKQLVNLGQSYIAVLCRILAHFL